jgi:hypothetical protein
MTRFADLERQLLALYEGGGKPENLPADNYLRKYAEWRTNLNSPARDLPEASTRDRLGLVGVIVRPFAFPGNDQETVVSMSRRAVNWVRSLNNEQKNSFAFVAPPTAADALAKLQIRTGYVPSQAIIREKIAPTSRPNEKRSRITGLKYKTRSDSNQQGYVVPYGRISATDTEVERKAAIKTAFPNFAVSFKSEKTGSSLALVNPLATT